MRGLELGRSEFGYGRPSLSGDMENDGTAAVTKSSDIKESRSETERATTVFSKDKPRKPVHTNNKR